MTSTLDSARVTDPVRLEILWQGILAATDEAAWTLIRTSFSNIVREAWDFGVMVYDARGRLVAQNTAVAGKVGLWHTVVAKLLDLYTLEGVHPGDVFISNDPWLADGHLYDVCIAMPVTYDGTVVGFVECCEHLSDIGGSISSTPRDLFEEGLIIPPVRIVAGGQEDHDLFRLIASNLRTPTTGLGDIQAMIACVRTCTRKLEEVLHRNRLAGLDEVADEIIARSEKATRAAIRTAIPDGTYYGDGRGDGYDAELEIRARIEVCDGAVTIDFAGSSHQSVIGINSPSNFTYVWTAFAIHCVAGTELRPNHGSFAPIRVQAPEGCVLNPRRGAPVRMRASSALAIPSVVFHALASASPDRVLADSSAPTWVERISGIHGDGQRFSQVIMGNGGMGARRTKDGISAIPFPNNASNTPVEVIEETLPLLMEERTLATGTGGAGRFRGGLGQRQSFVVLEPFNMIFQNERLKTHPRGLLGGGDGALGKALINDEPVAGKDQRALHRGDRVILQLPGGGGAEDPFTRSVDAVARDVRDELVSVEEAQREYGVVLDPITFEVNDVATARVRGESR